MQWFYYKCMCVCTVYMIECVACQPHCQMLCSHVDSCEPFKFEIFFIYRDRDHHLKTFKSVIPAYKLVEWLVSQVMWRWTRAHRNTPLYYINITYTHFFTFYSSSSHSFWVSVHYLYPVSALILSLIIYSNIQSCSILSFQTQKSSDMLHHLDCFLMQGDSTCREDAVTLGVGLCNAGFMHHGQSLCTYVYCTWYVSVESLPCKIMMQFLVSYCCSVNRFAKNCTI